MGIWNSDIICCDSTLDVAMEMLCKAGIGPSNYPPDSKSVVISSFGKYRFVSRYRPERYTEFFRCLENAQHRCAELEDPHMQKDLFDIAVGNTRIWDKTHRGQEIVGHGLHIFALIYMSAGCQIDESVRDVLLDSIDNDTWASSPCSEANERRSVIRHFRELVDSYDCNGRKAIFYRCMHPFDYFELKRQTDHDQELLSQRFVALISSRVSRRPADTKPPCTGPRFGIAVWKNFEKPPDEAEIASLRAQAAAENPGSQVVHCTSATRDGPVAPPTPYIPPTELNVRASKASKKIARKTVKDDTFNADKICAFCGTWQIGAKQSLKLKKCSRCHVTFYCSKKCQKEHWATHRKLCKKLSKKQEKKL